MSSRPRLRIPEPIPPPGVEASREPLEPAHRGRGEGARVWLVRHAEVLERWHETAYGSLDVPLSERGREQTRALGLAFTGRPLGLVLGSPLARARELAEAIAEASGAALELDESLREIFRGDWQGLAAAEFRARWLEDSPRFFADPWRWSPPGGEADRDVWERVRGALDGLLERAAGAEVALVAHSNVIRVLAGRALGASALESYGLAVDPAHQSLLVDAPEGFRLEARNRPAPDG